MIHSYVQNKLGNIQDLMKEHRIRKAYLFGSSVKETFSDKSDIDVLVDVDESIDPVELGGHLWDLQFALEDLLGRKIDLLTSRSLRNPFFIKEIEATKELIYG